MSHACDQKKLSPTENPQKNEYKEAMDFLALQTPETVQKLLHKTFSTLAPNFLRMFPPVVGCSSKKRRMVRRKSPLDEHKLLLSALIESKAMPNCAIQLNNPNSTQFPQIDLLSLLVEHNYIKLVQKCLKNGMPLYYGFIHNQKKQYALPLLHAKDSPVARLLLEAKAPLNVDIEDFGTPLTIATMSHYSPRLIELYLSHGMDPNHRDSTGKTPLQSLCYNNDPQKCEYSIGRKAQSLARSGAQFDLLDKNGKKAEELFQKNKNRGKKNYSESTTSN